MIYLIYKCDARVGRRCDKSHYFNFRKLKIDKVELNVRAANTRAIKCYQKCGFKEVSTITKNGRKAIHMEKQI